MKTPLVGTVEIVGIDRSDRRIERAIEQFERHAASPEKVAERILTGIEKNRYMVFTSADTRIGYWVQRKFAPPYELTMRLLNDRLNALARSQR